MKKNKQAIIKMSLIGIVASALIGGATATQIYASSNNPNLDTTLAYRDEHTDLLSAKKAQEHLAATLQEKQKTKEAQALKQQAAEQAAQQVAQQVEQQATQQTAQAAETTQTATATAQTATQEQIPSSGLYIDGISAQIGSYNVDGGQVPTYTPLAYHWNTPQMASHNYYLVDNSNTTGLGQKVLALQIGDPVYLNGQVYHVTASLTVYPNQYASELFDFSHKMYIQTCYGAYASDGMRAVMLD